MAILNIIRQPNTHRAWIAAIAFSLEPSLAQDFGPQNALPGSLAGARYVGTADIDGDGDLDAVGSGEISDSLVWYENRIDEGLGFGGQQVVGTGLDGIQTPTIADLDGDGWPDLVGMGQNSILNWYRNDGLGGFSAAINIDSPAGAPYGAEAGDLDGDGKDDLIVCTRNGSATTGRILWYRNNGAGSFGSAITLDQTSFAWRVRARDIDGDGDLDVLAALYYGDAFVWYENLGSGTFSGQKVIASAINQANDIATADIDGDSDLDLVTASEGGGDVFWFENRLSEASADFGTGALLAADPSCNRAFSVTAADLDADGDPDVLACCYSNNAVIWIENLGGGNFSSPVALDALGARPMCVHAADLNGDGLPDALSAYNSADGISWNENLMAPPDCNGNGVSDFDDISAGTSADCDANGIPDECDLASGTAVDCNANGIPDSCDLASGLEVDCNGNGVPDSCDLASGTSLDCDANGVPDECDLGAGTDDCDADGIPDVCEIADDATLDLNANGILDSCEAIGSIYCTPAIENSTGAPAAILALGSEVLASSDVTLTVRGLPLNTFAMFVTSQTQGYAFPIPGSQGALCVVGLPGRFNRPGQIQSSGSSGSLVFPVDVTLIPTPIGFTAALPGQTWNFQAWYRDANPTVTSNFTDAVAITFQ